LEFELRPGAYHETNEDLGTRRGCDARTYSHPRARRPGVQDPRGSHEDPKTSEIVRDGLSLSFDSAGYGRHPVTPRTDPHREEKRNFAKDLAVMLAAELEKKSFDRLILIAPPQMLGDLRAHLSDAVGKTVSASLDLDLTKTPDDKIASHLRDVVIA
jgi:protein required for attachment to host cells